MGNCVGQRRIGKPADGKGNTPKKNEAAKLPEHEEKQNTAEKSTVKKADAEIVSTNGKEDANKKEKDDNGAAQCGEDAVGADTKPPDFVVSHNSSDIRKEKTFANSELTGEQADKIDNEEAIEKIPLTQNNIIGEEEKTTEKEEKTPEEGEKTPEKDERTPEKDEKMTKTSMANQRDTEDEKQESIKNEKTSTQESNFERESKEANDKEMKDQDTKGQQKKEVNDITTIKLEVAGDRPKDEGQSENTKEEPETKRIATGNSVRNNSDTGKPEKLHVLHQVVQGRAVPMRETHEITKTISEIHQETEEEKCQKRLDVLEAKMKNYQRMKKSENNITDFEDSIFACEVVNRKVVLEDIIISGREVSGVIAISCHEQHPDVTVRYTSDTWKSVANEEAIPFNSTGNGSKIYRRFFFVIFVPFAKSLEFAVRLMGDLGTFWDNNNQNNYFVENIMENESASRLIAKFSLQKQAMFNELLKKNYVMLKSVSLKDGKVTLTIATKESCSDTLGVRFTLDDWETSADVTEIASKDEEEGHSISKIQIDVPKQRKMKCSIFWRHEGTEYWDNNNGKNYEIQG